MKTEVYIPKNKLIQKHIECFYFLSREKDEPANSYFTFPSLNSITSFSPHAELITHKNVLTIKHNPKINHISVLESPFIEPLKINMTGPLKEVTSYFKPLGLFNFVCEGSNHLANGTLHNFYPFDDYQETLDDVIEIKDGQTKGAILEKYWLSKYKPIQNQWMPKALEILHANPEIKINNLADELKVSRKTLIANFKKYVGRTPSDYRKVLRFRTAFEKPKINFSELSQALTYFDQAHMIKEFQKMTGHTPKKFFEKINEERARNLKWVDIDPG